MFLEIIKKKEEEYLIFSFFLFVKAIIKLHMYKTHWKTMKQ